MGAKPFRVWRGDNPITEWINGWDPELVKFLQGILEEKYKWEDWCDTEHVSFEDDDEPVMCPEEYYAAMVREERERQEKRRMSSLEKKIKQYNKLKEELGL